MKLASATLVALAATLAHAASSWSFQDATLTISSKGAGVGGTVKEKLTPSAPLTSPLPFTASDTLKLVLTTTDNTTPARPHQAFLTLVDPSTGLADSFAFDVKESGKAKIDVSYKDIPTALLTSPLLQAKITLASFGSSAPVQLAPFRLALATPPPAGKQPAEPERYTPLEEIHHIFKDGPRSPPVVITGAFALAVAAALPLLLGIWAAVGGNLSHAGEALGKAPIAYTLFLGSLVGIEGVFVAYYVSWSLFQMLPVVGLLAVVGGVSGSRALREVQARRLAGKR